MKALRKAALITLTCAMPLIGVGVPAASAAAVAPTQVLYDRGTDGYECFRIPALVKSVDGTLLAFAEARKTLAGGSWCADAAPIDTVVRRSRDNGKSWSAPSIVLSGSPDGAAAGATRGNPAPIVVTHGRHRGRIILLTTYNPAGGGVRIPFVQYSDNDGRSWSKARSLRPAIDDPSWGWIATGPSHGIELQHGRHAGRLLVGINYDDADGLTHGAIAYSDDAGDSWHLGADAVAPVQNHQFGELSVFEAKDGTVTAVARNKVAGDMTQSRMSASSTDGGSTFSPAGFQAVPDLATTPGVQGASLQVGNTTLFSSPVDPALRKNMTIVASRDSGGSWTSVRQLTTDRSGYSDLTYAGHGEVGVLYEAGDYPGGDARDQIRFDLVGLKELAPATVSQ
jgi:sialidase-1